MEAAGDDVGLGLLTLMVWLGAVAVRLLESQTVKVAVKIPGLGYE